MNKKFLSAVLFGALMVSSTGTFVSCKDYDDDIDELTSRVDGIESQIKDLEAKINAANWITSVTPATGGFTVAFNDGSSYTITNGKDGEAGAAGTEWTISEDVLSSRSSIYAGGCRLLYCFSGRQHRYLRVQDDQL